MHITNDKSAMIFYEDVLMHVGVVLKMARRKRRERNGNDAGMDEGEMHTTTSDDNEPLDNCCLNLAASWPLSQPAPPSLDAFHLTHRDRIMV